MGVTLEGYIFRSLATSVASEFDLESKTWTTVALASVRRSKNGIDWEHAEVGIKYSDKDFDTTVEKASSVLFGLLTDIKEADFKQEGSIPVEKVM